MGRWHGDNEDPFVKAGYVRAIIVRYNPEYRRHIFREASKDDLASCVDIVHVQSHIIGFLSPDIKDIYCNDRIAHSWVSDEFHECKHQLDHLFKDKSNGIYEIICDLYNWNSRSYEGEWDGESEIRNLQIKEISYAHGMYFGEYREGLSAEIIQLRQFCNTNTNYAINSYHSYTDIHYYMPKRDILVNHINALTILYSGSYDRCYETSRSLKDSSIEDLENTIFMLMLQIDSEKQHLKDLSVSMEEAVQYVLKQHDQLMNPEFA